MIRSELDIDVLDMLQYCLKIVGADIGDYIKFGMVEIVIYDSDGPMKDEDGKLIKEFYNGPIIMPSKEVILVRFLYDNIPGNDFSATITPVKNATNVFSHSGFEKLKVKYDEEFILHKAKKR